MRRFSLGLSVNQSSWIKLPRQYYEWGYFGFFVLFLPFFFSIYHWYPTSTHRHPIQSSPFGLLPACRSRVLLKPHFLLHEDAFIPIHFLALLGKGEAISSSSLLHAVHPADTHCWSSSKQRGVGEEKVLIPTSLSLSSSFRRSPSVHPNQGRLVTNRLRNDWLIFSYLI